MYHGTRTVRSKNPRLYFRIGSVLKDNESTNCRDWSEYVFRKQYFGVFLFGKASKEWLFFGGAFYAPGYSGTS